MRYDSIPVSENDTIRLPQPENYNDCLRLIGSDLYRMSGQFPSRRSTVGAGAVVVKNIPAGSTCAGVPAHVLNHNNPARYIHNPYTPQD